MNGRPFTEEEDDYLIWAHDERRSLAEMAYSLDRPYGSICTRRAYLGLKYKDRIVGSEPGDPVETEWPEPVEPVWTEEEDLEHESVFKWLADNALYVFNTVTAIILIAILIGVM
jgi:hypothetical protein